MKKFLFAFLILASCSGGDQPADQKEGRAAAGGGAASSSPAGSPSGRLTTLTGLYEGGSGEQRHQMCIVGEGQAQRFGLVVWGKNMHSCSGSGTVTRGGDKLRLTMAGDAECTVEAIIAGNSVKLPQATPQGCNYYCGEQASLGSAELRQTGSTKSDAMKARDIVGDPLCEG